MTKADSRGNLHPWQKNYEQSPWLCRASKNSRKAPKLSLFENMFLYPWQKPRGILYPAESGRIHNLPRVQIRTKGKKERFCSHALNSGLDMDSRSPFSTSHQTLASRFLAPWQISTHHQIAQNSRRYSWLRLTYRPHNI